MGKQKMSGRGTINCPTRTSPKVRRFLMKSRSMAAIMPTCRLSSTMRTKSSWCTAGTGRSARKPRAAKSPRGQPLAPGAPEAQGQGGGDYRSQNVDGFHADQQGDQETAGTG